MNAVSAVYLALSGFVLSLQMQLFNRVVHNDTVGAFDDKVMLKGQWLHCQSYPVTPLVNVH